MKRNLIALLTCTVVALIFCFSNGCGKKSTPEEKTLAAHMEQELRQAEQGDLILYKDNRIAVIMRAWGDKVIVYEGWEDKPLSEQHVRYLARHLKDVARAHGTTPPAHDRLCRAFVRQIVGLPPFPGDSPSR